MEWDGHQPVPAGVRHSEHDTRSEGRSPPGATLPRRKPDAYRNRSRAGAVGREGGIWRGISYARPLRDNPIAELARPHRRFVRRNEVLIQFGILKTCMKD